MKDVIMFIQSMLLISLSVRLIEIQRRLVLAERIVDDLISRAIVKVKGSDGNGSNKTT